LTTQIFVDSTGTISLVFTDDAAAAVDPSAIALVIKDSLGATKTTKAIGDLTHDSTGHYHYHYDTASTDATGLWYAVCTATIATLNEVSVATFQVTATQPWTTYFSVTADMVRDRYRAMDTSITDLKILAEAQSQEYWVMRRRGIAAAPTDAIELANMQLATALLTCAAIEEGEPHSRADGSVREDRFNRVLWRKQAYDIVDGYRTDVPIAVTRWGD
jgi:hypothetical protein